MVSSSSDKTVNFGIVIPENASTLSRHTPIMYVDGENYKFTLSRFTLVRSQWIASCSTIHVWDAESRTLIKTHER